MERSKVSMSNLLKKTKRLEWQYPILEGYGGIIELNEQDLT